MTAMLRTTRAVQTISKTQTARFSVVARRMAGGDTGAPRSGGAASGDAFTKREEASENLYIKRAEAEKIKALKAKIAKQEKELAKDKETLASHESNWRAFEASHPTSSLTFTLATLPGLPPDNRNHVMMPPVTRAAARKTIPAETEPESDYGSDFDEDDLSELLPWSSVISPLAVEPIDAINPLPQVARIPRIPGASPVITRTSPAVEARNDAQPLSLEPDATSGAPRIDIEYEVPPTHPFEARNSRQTDDRSVAASPDIAEDDPRSPLERFRAQRRRPMSVTDIVSPAWCELQYFYNLAKYGRVQQTPAMRQGSNVHKVLEEEVHVAAPVEVMTRADGFGLRIWNVIQGLRTLRMTGMTREFEVWGVVEGQVVNGVIDQLSYTCPDPKFEAALSSKLSKSKKEKPLPKDQPTLKAFLGASTDSPSDAVARDQRKVYITDVKTRASKSAPKDEVALRPTYMQLMLYHDLLSQLVSDAVPRDRIFERYHITPDEIFSDVFISQIAGLDQPSISSQESAITDPLTELLAHNTARTLWDLMLAEFTLAIPEVSPIFSAEYRANSTGDILGTRLFLHDARRLHTYVTDEMAWWTGQRPARGVDIEEAFKCRICAFADGCTWRQTKLYETIAAARAKRAATTSI